MRCDDISEWMSASIDGHLDEQQKALLQAHLDGCENCREAFETLKQTVSLLQELDPVAPPADLLQTVHARLEPRRGRLISWLVFNRPQVRVALAASLVVVVCLYGLRHMDRDAAETYTSAASSPRALETRIEADAADELVFDSKQADAPGIAAPNRRRCPRLHLKTNCARPVKDVAGRVSITARIHSMRLKVKWRRSLVVMLTAPHE